MGWGVGNGTEDVRMQAHLGGSRVHSETGITYDLRQEQSNIEDLDLKRRPVQAATH